MLTQSREEDIRHAGAVCGWFSGNWVPRRSRQARHRGEAHVVLHDALALVADTPDLTRLIEGILERTESCVTRFNWGERHSFAGEVRASSAIEAVNAFAARVRGVRAVEAVLFEEVDGRARVWTILNEYDRDAEDAVYAAEGRMLAEHTNIVFSFGIFYRHGRPLHEVRPATASDAYLRA